MKNKTYSIERYKKARDLVYLDYDNLDGYVVKPKVCEKDAIEVSKVLFVNKDLTEKIIKKKIDKKIKELLDFLNSDDSSDNGNLERNLMACEKLRMQIIEKYVKYLGNTYQKLILNKLQIIMNEIRFKLFSYSLYNDDEMEYIEKKGKGR